MKKGIGILGVAAGIVMLATMAPSPDVSKTGYGPSDDIVGTSLKAQEPGGDSITVSHDGSNGLITTNTGRIDLAPAGTSTTFQVGSASASYSGFFNFFNSARFSNTTSYLKLGASCTDASGLVSEDICTGGTLAANKGIVPAKVSADPCGSYPGWTIFMNTTSGYACFCTGAGVDVRLHDPASACF